MNHYHTPKPFYRPKKNRWYVQLDGKHINLGSDEKQALARYHEIMAQRANTNSTTKPSSNPSDHPFLISIYDQYLDWLSKRVDEGSKQQRTFVWYQTYIQSFIRFENEHTTISDLTVDQIQPIHVYQWIDSNPTWVSGKRGAMIAVQRPLTWAAKAGLLKSINSQNPLTNLEKPQQGRRDQLVTEPEYQEILSVLTCNESHDLIELAWETGMRPLELCSFEAKFFEPDNARLVFPIRLSKGRKVQRVVYLNERALEIVKRRIIQYPTGPVLRNADGNRWCSSSTNCLFRRVQRNIGRKRMKSQGLIPAKIPRLKVSDRNDKAKQKEHDRLVRERLQAIRNQARKLGTKYSLYVLRHAYITEALVSGIDAVTVSLLAGHRDTTMISRVYSHVDQNQDHMRKAANQAKRKEPKQETMSDSNT